METVASHYYNWGGVLFFTLLYCLILFFVPFYRKMDYKPEGTYVAFVLAFAIEMHGIPFSMWLVSWVFGKNLPEGILWGHTFVSIIGHWGMYINILCAIIALFLILNGWHHIYKNYWSKELTDGKLVKKGVYRYIRHPQYAGLLLLSFGMLVEWATLPLLVLFPVIIYMYVSLAKKEEADMIKAFGEEYKEYMKQTNMFLPYIF